MLCCILPMALAGAVTAVTGVAVNLFSGPALFITVPLMVLSTIYFLSKLYHFLSSYFYGTQNPDCPCESQGKKAGSCHSKITEAMAKKPCCKTTASSNEHVEASEADKTTGKCDAQKTVKPKPCHSGCSGTVKPTNELPAHTPLEVKAGV